MAQNSIDSLIQTLSRLPGLGPRSGRRLSLFLLKRKDTILDALITILQDAKENIKVCEVCGNIDMQSPCSICEDSARDKETLCIIQDVADLWAIERSKQYKGQYRVLGGLLSAIEGMGPEELGFEAIKKRIMDEEIKEVILALPLTVEGQTTNHYLQEMFEEIDGVKITTLAHGVPVGGELDYLDDATIKTAISARRIV